LNQKLEKDWEGTIYHYMKEQNRPYSHNDIFLNHAKRMPKTGIQATLEKLAKDGFLVEKMYGKTAIYVVNQVSLFFIEIVKLEYFLRINSKLSTKKATNS